MKTLSLLLPLVLILGLTAIHAQTPVPEPDTLKSQVKQTDPVPNTTPRDANYLQNKVKITSAELPDAVQRTLESNSQYQGWESAGIYKDRAGDLFLIEIEQADSKRVFRFDKSGMPVIEE